MNIGRRGGCTLPFALVILLASALISAALAQETPNPTTPGYQICSSASGVTVCSFQPLDLTHPLPVAQTPPGVAIQGNGTGTTGAVVGTLAASTTAKTYLCDFDVSATGTGSVGPITVAGLLGGSKVYQLTAPGSVSKSFSPCLAGSAINTAITITTTADGTATAVNVNSSGYQQ